MLSTAVSSPSYRAPAIQSGQSIRAPLLAKRGTRSRGRPVIGRRSRLPKALNTTASLAQDVAIRLELMVEGELFTWMSTRIVNFVAPDSQRTKELRLCLVVPPVLPQVLQLPWVAAVQRDDCSPHRRTPLWVSAIGF